MDTRDPLVKVGAWAMAVAFGFAIVVGVGASLNRPMEVAAANAANSEPKPAASTLIRTDPGIDPWVERNVPPPRPKVSTKPQPAPQPEVSSPDPPSVGARQPASAPKPAGKPNPPEPQAERHKASTPNKNAPTQARERAQQVNHAPGHNHLPPGAIMTLTIPEIGLREVPVMDSVTKSALERGVVHLPDTSLPWTETPERNVYLAGHRLGWAGTGSHLVFYRLDELTGGERVTLRARDGTKYDYRVLESFIVGPRDNWVTGRVKGRDLVTLQTCTPIPTFQKRLIVRAERI